MLRSFECVRVGTGNEGLRKKKVEEGGGGDC